MGAWRPGVKSHQNSFFSWEKSQVNKFNFRHWDVSSMSVYYHRKRRVCTFEVHVLCLLIFNLNHEFEAFLWIFSLMLFFSCSDKTTHVLYLWLSTLWLFRYDLRQWNNSNPWYIGAASSRVHQRIMNINNIPNEGYKTYPANNPDTIY